MGIFVPLPGVEIPAMDGRFLTLVKRLSGLREEKGDREVLLHFPYRYSSQAEQKIPGVWVSKVIPCAYKDCLCCILIFIHIWVSSTPWTIAHQVPLFMGLFRQEYCRFLLQGIFLTQGLNRLLLCLLSCRWILYWPSHQGSPNTGTVIQWDSVVLPSGFQ